MTQSFFAQAADQHHPLRLLKEFLEREHRTEQAHNYTDLRFVGYVLEIGYDTVTLITSDPFKVAVGGVPRNSMLIMVPSGFEDIPLHFTLLRVLDVAPTPLSQDVQQTYFELQKRSMPELDVFTQSELQWGALKTAVLGMFYKHPVTPNAIEFAGDMNNFVSAHKYRVYAPDDALLNLIVNSMVPDVDRFQLGDLRMTENRLPLQSATQPTAKVMVSARDFMATRTAMFGKTRLGKSNVVKLIAQSLIETTEPAYALYSVNDAALRALQPPIVPQSVVQAVTQMRGRTINGRSAFLDALSKAINETAYIQHSEQIANACRSRVGQVIFDVNGEYANDNPQDNSRSLASTFPSRCQVYAITPKPNTLSRPLKLNFYEHPSQSQRVLSERLELDGRGAIYVKDFLSAEVPSVESLADIKDQGDLKRAKRRILMYWAILKKANFEVDEQKLIARVPLNPGYNRQLREALYGNTPVPTIQNLQGLVNELDLLAVFIRDKSDTDPIMRSQSGNPLFERDDRALLTFLNPSAGAGTAMLSPYRKFHAANAGNYTKEIINLVDQGQTVIIDLGNADPQIMEYFSQDLSRAIFHHQVEKFSTNTLGNHVMQLYFEEAHNLFPARDDNDGIDIYQRLAKEGAKYGIGMVYSTQSVTSINRDLLGQTENFFIAHMASRDEVNALAKVQIAYEGMQDDILRSKTPGYLRMLTRSHRFVIPVQARKFDPTVASGTNNRTT